MGQWETSILHKPYWVNFVLLDLYIFSRKGNLWIACPRQIKKAILTRKKLLAWNLEFNFFDFFSKILNVLFKQMVKQGLHPF